MVDRQRRAHKWLKGHDIVICISFGFGLQIKQTKRVCRLSVFGRRVMDNGNVF